MRVFCITGAALQGRVPPRRADESRRHIDHVAYGETVYGPLHDPMFVAEVASVAGRAARSGAGSPPGLPRPAGSCTSMRT